jgi:hypothetical protein
MNCKIVKVRSDHGGEFKNKHFENLFDSNGISHDFFCPRTPQQNIVVERKNDFARNGSHHDPRN